MQVIAALGLLLATASEPIDIPSSAFGPYSNKDDQYRYFWSGPWQEFVDIGFNMPASSHSRDYDFDRDALTRPDFPGIRQKDLERSHRTGIGYAERLGVWPRKIPKSWLIANRDGTTAPDWIDASNPDVFAALMKGFRTTVAALPDDPALCVLHVMSEKRDRARPSFTPAFAAVYRRASGGKEIPPEVRGTLAPHYSQIRGFPLSRIVPDDDPLLAFYRWYWKDGDGWNRYCTETTKVCQDRRHPVATMFDPVTRALPIRGSGGKVTFVNQWTYVVPDPYNCCFAVSEEQAMVRGRPGQGVWSMIQGMVYRAPLVAPGDPPAGTEPPDWYRLYPKQRYLTTPPDLMREAMWSLFARKLDGICYYSYPSIIPGTGPSKTTSYLCTDTNTYYVIGELHRRIGEPLGPLLRAVPERAPQVAFLESFSSSVFTHKASMGNNNSGIFQNGSEAVVAGLQPSVLYEDDLADGGVPESVRVVLAPDCDVLSEKSFAALRAWQLKGGVLIADDNLPPALMRDYDFPLPDRGGSARTALASVRKAARRLREIVANECPLHAGTSRDDVFTWVRTAGSADYVFAINDNRTTGGYVGQWDLVCEKGLPSRAQVWVRRSAGAVYDLERHCAVPFSVADGRTTASVDLKPCDGAVLMFVDRPFAPLSVAAKAEGDGVAVDVRAEEKDVMIPIEVTGEGLLKPFYGVMRCGRWRHAFTGVRLPLRVRNLADGSVREVVE